MKPSGNKSKVRLDVNNPIFLEGLFELDKNDRHAVLNTLMKISKLTWDQVYLDKGLHWEEIRSKRSLSGETLYSIRITRKHRALVLRVHDFMRFVSLHPDHDSAYR